MIVDTHNKHPKMAPPVVYFTSEAEEGTDPYTAAYVLGHTIFFMFNVIHVVYFLSVQGYALGNLGKNKLFQLTALGCFIQLGSCYSSVSRWNTGDPHGFRYGVPSAICGIMAHVPEDMVYVFLMFYKNDQPAKVKIGCGLILAWGVLLSFLSYTNWDYTGASFKYLLGYGPLSTLFHLIVTFRFRSALNKGEVSTEGDSDEASKVLLVAILLDVAAVAMEMAAPPVFQNGAPGIHYSATILTVMYVSGWTAAGYAGLP